VRLNRSEASALSMKLREVAAVLRAAGLYLCAGLTLAAADFIDDVVACWGDAAAFVDMARKEGTGEP
jgi:hypothetical protein